MMRLEWTGQSMPNAGLLYQSYRDLADVYDDDKRIGTVLHLPNGFYRPSLDGLRGEDLATPDQAMREVGRLHKLYRRTT